MTRGIVLILVSGLLSVLAILAALFVRVGSVRTQISRQYVESARARLLACSGMEYASARLKADPSVPGVRTAANQPDDWTYRDDPSVLLAWALNPSYRHRRMEPYTDLAVGGILNGRYDAGSDAYVDLDGNGQADGFSGRLRGTGQRLGDVFSLRIEDANTRIHVNGGRLDAALSPVGTPYHKDTAPGGPNGWLVRLLNNLDAAVTGAAPGTLGGQVVGVRPAGGYATADALRTVIGDARYAMFERYLTLHAWVDPKVARPQPMDGRPNRFLDVDDRHRGGANSPATISGLPVVGGVAGSGTEASPWTQTVQYSNDWEGAHNYPLPWERNFVYAWRQLRLGDADLLEPRAPVNVNGASREALSAVLLGLRGVHLDVWEGTGGWDGGFGWYNTSWEEPVQPTPALEATYVYPSEATEQAPWHRSRADHGSGYGVPGRPWYGPGNYNPLEEDNFQGFKGRSLVRLEPLGRLKETLPLTRAQSLAIADQVRLRIVQAGRFRSQVEFTDFVSRLPAWEDVNGDLVLDGAPYTVTTNGAPDYTRRVYWREDWNSSGTMDRQVFTVASGSWGAGNIAWVDREENPLAAGDVPGLTAYQKDVIRAMANPNTDVNDFNPDGNLWKEVDKTDLAGIRYDPADYMGGGDYAHTTEFSLDPAGLFAVESLGRVRDRQGAVRAERKVSGVVRVFELWRDTTQADFMRGYASNSVQIADLFTTPASPLPGPAGGQGLVSYPEPQTAGGVRAADAAYDGQIGLGFQNPLGYAADRLRGSLFDTLDASALGDAAAPDVRGPSQARLVGDGTVLYGTPQVWTPAESIGSLFPDGAYSEKDASLKYPMDGGFPMDQTKWNFTETRANPRVDGVFLDPSSREIYVFYVSFWVKPNWFPEACPRPHSLLSLSPGGYGSGATDSMGFDGVFSWSIYDLRPERVPACDVAMHPVGLYFVPSRNSLAQTSMNVYDHNYGSTRGRAWPCRSLLWGATHSLCATDSLHRRGIEPPPTTHPVGRLQAHRWHHVAVVAKTTKYESLGTYSALFLSGRSEVGSGWANGLGMNTNAIVMSHADGTPNHMRFGEIAAANNMNYVADATFANVQTGGLVMKDVGSSPVLDGYKAQFATVAGGGTPAAAGRYFKETGSAYRSALLPAGARPLRVTWTEIPADLWFDGVSPDAADGWLGDPATGYLPGNDRFGPGGTPGGDGLRDVRVKIEVWDAPPVGADVLLGTFQRAGDPNRIPVPKGRLYYKAVFVNDWSANIRLNYPLDETPFLDDVTVAYAAPAGSRGRFLSWEEE